MNFSTTLRLLCVVLLLAALIAVFDREKPVDVQKSLLGLKASNITDLKIERGDFSVYCFKKGESWFIAEPIQARADDSRLDGIAGALETMERDEVVTLAERDARKLTLKDYGLHKPRVRLIVGVQKDGGICKEELWIGQDSPLGEAIYVKLGTNDEVVATDRSIMTVIPETIEALRDRAILHGDVSKTIRLEIKRANSGFVQLTHVGNDWFIQQPIVARADSARIQQMLEALFLLKAVDFVWDANIETGDVVRVSDAISPNSKAESYRLVPDQAVVGGTVWLSGEEVGRELLFGREVEEKSDKIYARCRDIDSIYTVHKSVLDFVNIGVNEMRDRNLFLLPTESVNSVVIRKGDRKLVLDRNKAEGWNIVEPIQWKADDRFISSLIDNIAGLRVESFLEGTNNVNFEVGDQLCMISLSDICAVTIGAETNKVEKPAENAAEKSTVTNLKQGGLIVGPPREGKETVLAKFEEEPFVFEISSKSLDFMGKDPVDPLIYRNRTMLSIDPATVKSISMLKGGAETVVEKNENGRWVVSGSGTNQIDEKVIDEMLFIVADMRAMRTYCQNPDNLVQYGLDRSGVTLTFGLTGESGIRKTVVIGFRARTDGVYAMVQGLDVVFVISNELMGALTRDLIKLAPVSP